MTWQVAKLSDICEFHNGLWKGDKGPFLNVGVIRNTNFTKDGSLDDRYIAYLDVEAKKFEKRRLQFGDIILEKSGGGPKQAVGRVAFFDKRSGDYSFSNFTSAIRVRDPKTLSAEYLHRFLHWQYLSGVTEPMQSHSTGIRNLDGDAYKAIEVRFPEIREQHRIVALLDEAFAGIATAKANTETSLQRAGEALAIRVERQFDGGKDQRRLGSVCNFENGDRGKNYPGKQHRVPDGVPFINAGHLAESTVDFSEMDYISEERFSLLANGKIQPRDILFCLRGSLGKFADVGELNRGAIASSLVILRPDAQLDRDYLLAFLSSRQCIEQIERFKGGAAQPNLGARDLKQFVLPLPSVTRQREVVDELARLRAEIVSIQSLYTRKLAALDELKQSLLQRAFSGEL